MQSLKRIKHQVVVLKDSKNTKLRYINSYVCNVFTQHAKVTPKHITLKVMQIFLRSSMPTKYFENQTKLFTVRHIQMTPELGPKTKAWHIKRYLASRLNFCLCKYGSRDECLRSTLHFESDQKCLWNLKRTREGIKINSGNQPFRKTETLPWYLNCIGQLGPECTLQKYAYFVQYLIRLEMYSQSNRERRICRIKKRKTVQTIQTTPRMQLQQKLNCG